MSWPPAYQGQPYTSVPGYGTTGPVPAQGPAGIQSAESGPMAASAGGAQPQVENVASGVVGGQAAGVGQGQPSMPVGGEFDVPRADVHELPETYLVEIEMPGFEKADISVYADENRLIVSGERPVEEAQDRRIVQRERPIRLERTLQLPVAVDVEETTATYEAGVCAIEVPKGEAEERKRIGFQ